MNFYHDLVTQKSWQELQNLVKVTKFILIGGWAIYLYTKALKSKDIDIIIDFHALSALQRHYQIYKNDRLQKYEAVKDEVQIDIYLPHFSNLGIPVADLINNSRSFAGFTLLEPNYLFILKLYVLKKRGRTPKGRKDFLDLLALIQAKVCNFDQIDEILHHYHLLELKSTLVTFISENTQIPELKLNSHQYARLKSELSELLKK